LIAESYLLYLAWLDIQEELRRAPFQLPSRPHLLIRTHFQLNKDSFEDHLSLVEHIQIVLLPTCEAWDFSDYSPEGSVVSHISPVPEL
jgi:hypothetical protein